MKTRWLLSDPVPSFTREIAYLDDLISIVWGDGLKQPINRSPIGTGVTNSVYKCTATTNVGGLIIPLKFSFELFFPVANNEMALTRLVEGVTLSASTKCDKASLLPEIPESMTVNFKKNSGPRNVTDKRFRKHVMDVCYYMREKWLTDDEVKQLLDYKVAVAQTPRFHSEVGKGNVPKTCPPVDKSGH